MRNKAVRMNARMNSTLLVENFKNIISFCYIQKKQIFFRNANKGRKERKHNGLYTPLHFYSLHRLIEPPESLPMKKLKKKKNKEIHIWNSPQIVYLVFFKATT